MANTSSEMRLVKCPKCHSYLPEYQNVPVYRCGRCNTILRAKLRTTSGETATTESTQQASKELSEKDSFNETITESESTSLLNNSSEKPIEDKILNSTGLQTRNTDKLVASGSEKPESLSHENLNLNSNGTEIRLKEEHVETGEKKEEQSKEKHASVPVHRAVFSYLDDGMNKHKVPKRKETTSTSSQNIQSAQKFTGLESKKPPRNVSEAAVAYRKPPKSSHSYEVLQADILSKVDKLRDELLQLFGKAPEEKELSHLVRAASESSRYRRNRITPQESTAKPHQHHYHFQNTQAHKHGRKPKNHCRPILVGAPFVICSDCFRLIQVPADFNISTKRLRKLQCGNCSKILLYSYRPQPYNSNDTTPRTPSDSETGTSLNNDPFPRGDPISISEGYGMSFGISYSTDPDPGPPLYVSRNSSYSTKDGSRSGRQRVGSRLHQIMGYESASDILLRQSSEISSRIDENSERERKGKAIIEEHSEIGLSKSKLRRHGQESPKRSGIHGLIKKGIIKLKPSMH